MTRHAMQSDAGQQKMMGNMMQGWRNANDGEKNSMMIGKNMIANSMIERWKDDGQYDENDARKRHDERRL